VSLFVQFSIPPLLPELKQALELSKAELWSSNIYSMVGGVFSRFLLGPLSDQYGAKLMVTLLLAFMAIPCALTGLLVSFAGLCLVRLVIGSLDNSVPCQYWITCHFVRDRSGSAMALSSGLAAMGSCLVQPILGSLVFPLCVALVVDHDMAWRLALVVPALLAIATASFFFRYSEDCPLGSYHEIKSAGLMTERSAMDSFRSGALNLNSWILCLQ
jgi:NNP family nitrate/nitrite transporter-like MFS transporter